MPVFKAMFPLINHTMINSKRHLNRKNQLNSYGKFIFIRNLNNFNWRIEVHDEHVFERSPSLIDSVNGSLSDLVSIKVQKF